MVSKLTSVFETDMLDGSTVPTAIFDRLVAMIVHAMITNPYVEVIEASRVDLNDHDAHGRLRTAALAAEDAAAEADEVVSPTKRRPLRAS